MILDSFGWKVSDKDKRHSVPHCLGFFFFFCLELKSLLKSLGPIEQTLLSAVKMENLSDFSHLPIVELPIVKPSMKADKKNHGKFAL
jgi:hypothetical protein